MEGFTIRGYSGHDDLAVLDAWEAALPYDPVDQPTFHRKVLLDPNFDPDWLLVALTRGLHPVGFCLCLVRRVPLEGLDLEPERGWITAFAVHPEYRGQGLGSALLERALDLFRQAGRREVLISPYTPNYFVPGVDVQAYAAGLEFLQHRGFGIISRPLSMDANLVLLDPEPWLAKWIELGQRNIKVLPLLRCETPSLLRFLQEHMPADWVRHARELLVDVTRGLADWEQFTVAYREREIVGYCQFEGEHFGPFGVREDLRGQGIGTVLLSQSLLTMRRRGHHNAWVLWTSDEAAERVYARFGFRETRRFAVLRRAL